MNQKKGKLMTKEEMIKEMEKLKKLGNNMATELEMVREKHGIFTYTDVEWTHHQKGINLKDDITYRKELEEFLDIED